MAVEAELKAVVRDPGSVLAALEQAAGPGRAEVYRDTYYDDPAGTLTDADRELRIRTVHGPGPTRTVLTYKGARVDEESGSKPEHETRLDDPAAAHEILRGLGYAPRIAFEKHCRNYALTADGMARMFAWFEREQPDATALREDVPSAFLVALPAAMAQVTADLVAEHGSIRAYVLSLGVSAAALDRLESELLEEPAN